MFEYVSRKRDPVTVAIYCGGIPFAIAWVLHNSIGTAFALEAYLITIVVFVINPVELQSENVKQRWFWKGLITGGIVIHPLLLGGLWYLDSNDPAIVKGGGTLFFVAIMVGALESVVLNTIAFRYRPKNEAARTTGEVCQPDRTLREDLDSR